MEAGKHFSDPCYSVALLVLKQILRSAAAPSSGSESDGSPEPSLREASAPAPPAAAREDWMTKAMPRSAPAVPGAPDAAAADEQAAKKDQPVVSVSAQALVFKQLRLCWACCVELYQDRCFERSTTARA